jgi:hypothetical protein
VPIVVHQRRAGASKMTVEIIAEAFLPLRRMRMVHLARGKRPSRIR